MNNKTKRYKLLLNLLNVTKGANLEHEDKIEIYNRLIENENFENLKRKECKKLKLKRGI